MGKYLGSFLSVIVGAGIVIGAVFALGVYSRIPAPISGQPAGGGSTFTQHVSLTLQTFPASPYSDAEWLDKHRADYGANLPPAGDNQDWVTYWPSTELVVPAHALVTIRIENYDGATPLLNPFYSRSRGITDDHGTPTDTFQVDGQAVTAVDPDQVSHTFTIHSIPSATKTWLDVSVPVMAVDESAPADDAGFPDKPVVTEFSFVTGDAGSYIWQCFDPCGSGYNGFGGPMSTKGYMSGTLTVQ